MCARWTLVVRLASERALVPGPVHRGMTRGSLVRVEELTRMPPEVQDALVTILSEKVLPIPELDSEVAADGASQVAHWRLYYDDA